MNKTIGKIYTIAAILIAASLQAQTPAAPIPPQIATAKNIFLANAGSNIGVMSEALAGYSLIYQKLSQSNRYRIVTAPADADLILETSLNTPDRTDSYFNRYFQLTIRDAKSQALLWTISEAVEGANREKTADRNMNDAAAQVLADLLCVASGNTASVGDANCKANPATGVSK